MANQYDGVTSSDEKKWILVNLQVHTKYFASHAFLNTLHGNQKRIIIIKKKSNMDNLEQRIV